MPVITLDSKKYVVEKNLDRESLVDPLSEPVRFTGTQQRDDNRKLSTSIYDFWSAGLGYRGITRRTGYGVDGFWKSTCETRFKRHLYNGLMEHAVTHAGEADHLVRYLNFNSEYIGLFESDYASGSINHAVSRKFNASTDTFDDTASADDPTLNGGSDGTTSSATSLAVNHTVQSTNGGRVAVARIYTHAASGGGHPTGVTYGGVAMTRLVAVGASQNFFSLWYLTNPLTGSNSCSATGIPATSEILMRVSDYYNCDTVSPFASSTGSSGSGQSRALTLTVEDDDLVIGMFGHSQQGDITVGTGQTEEAEIASSNIDASFSEERSSGESTTFDHSYTTDATSSANGAVAAVLHAPNGIIAVANANATGVRLFDATIHKGRIYAIGSAAYGNERRPMVWASFDGAAWVEEAGTNWPTEDYFSTTVTRRNNFDDDMARLYDDGNTLYAAVYNSVTKLIHVLTSTDEGTTWTDEVQVASSDGPKGLQAFWNREGANEVMLGTAEGIYAIDITDNEAVREYQTDGQAANCRFMALGDDGNLYVPLADDDLVQISLGPRVAEGIFQWNTVRIGPMAGRDGLPSEWRGHANYVMSGNSVGGIGSRWLWVLYGGHEASTTATVMCYDYEESRQRDKPVWHCFHDAQENSITNMGQNVDLTMMGLSSADDGKMRLHVTAEHSAAALMMHFEEPLVDHVSSDVTGKYLADTIVRFPIDDHGDPHKAGAMMRGEISALELDTSGNNQEKVGWKYGLEGGDWPDVSPGTFYSDALTISLGSGLGVAMSQSMHELTLTRGSGDNTERAVVTEFQVLWRKRYATLESHKFRIDLAKSAEAEPGIKGDTDTERVITNLKAIRDLGILVTLGIGNATDINVEMAGYEAEYTIIDEGDGRGEGRRTGFWNVVLDEVE